MILFYRFIIKFLKFLIQAILGLQALLSMLIFFTALFWMLDLAGVNFLYFLYPVTDAITNFMKTFYHQQVQIGDDYFDGSILLFDLLLIALVYSLSKLKEFCEVLIERAEYEHFCRKKQREDEFNKKLQEELEQEISKLQNIAILLELDVKNYAITNIWKNDKEDAPKEKIDEIFGDLQQSLDRLINCKITRKENRILILCDKFSYINKLLDTVTMSLSSLQSRYKKQRMLITFYAGLELYTENENIDYKIYARIQNLVELKIPDEILAFENFNIRYGMLAVQNYEISKKGRYDLRSFDEDICLIKIIKKF